jgi:hypothetical protein
MANINKKRVVIRIIAFLCVVAVACGLFYIGKQHNILLDNRKATIEGKEFDAAKYVRVVIDGNEKDYIEFAADDRDAVDLEGPFHTVKVIEMDEDTEKVIKTVERKMNFGVENAKMLSLPAILAEAPNVDLPLPENMQQAEEAAEETQTSENEGTESHSANDSGKSQ